MLMHPEKKELEHNQIREYCCCLPASFHMGGPHKNLHYLFFHKNAGKRKIKNQELLFQNVIYYRPFCLRITQHWNGF